MPSPKRTPGQNSIASTRVKQSNASCYSDAFSGDRKNNTAVVSVNSLTRCDLRLFPKFADDHEYISPGHAHMATRCQVERTSERESKDKDFCTAIIANSGSVFKRNVNFARTTATLGKTNASIPRDDDEEEEEEEETDAISAPRREMNDIIVLFAVVPEADIFFLLFLFLLLSPKSTLLLLLREL